MQIHSLFALCAEILVHNLQLTFIVSLTGANAPAAALPYVAAVVRHDVGMLAAFHNDDLLLDDGEIILCGIRRGDSH